jgi:hypothetical protein
MIVLLNQRAVTRSEHATINAAKAHAKKLRRANPYHDRFVIYAPHDIYLAKPGIKPRGRMSRDGVPVSEMPLVWTPVSTINAETLP